MYVSFSWSFYIPSCQDGQDFFRFLKTNNNFTQCFYQLNFDIYLLTHSVGTYWTDASLMLNLDSSWIYWLKKFLLLIQGNLVYQSKTFQYKNHTKTMSELCRCLFINVFKIDQLFVRHVKSEILRSLKISKVSEMKINSWKFCSFHYS